MKRWRIWLRRLAWLAAGVFALAVVAFLIHFPGRQSRLAFTLATGVGVEGLQSKVDWLEELAIRGKPYTEADIDFLGDLYTCFAKGARLTRVLRQSAQLMDHYLSKSGQDLEIEPRVFQGSRLVREQVAAVVSRIASDAGQGGVLDEEYASPTFHMGDPEFFESFVALYFGRVIARPLRLPDGRVSLHWRAEMPWQWPSYESLQAKYGDPHAQCFPLPNARSLLLGPRYCLRMDDGLGEHLAHIGLATPFLVRSQWVEIQDLQTSEHR